MDTPARKCTFSGPVTVSSSEIMNGNVSCPYCNHSAKVANHKSNEDWIRHIKKHNHK